MNSEYYDDQELPSKSLKKRQMTALQDLGRELTTLNKKQLAKLPIDPTLEAALKEYERLPNSHEARRRQLQFIGKVIRKSDHELIQSELQRMREPDPTEIRRGKTIENWAQELVDGDEDAINRFVADYPTAERQHLRQLLRNIKNADPEAAAPRRRRMIDYIKTFI
jgi:ribosome-associated protein